MVTISPAGLSTTALVADQVSILATFTESLYASYCVNSTRQPQYSITYTYGTPTLNGTTAFVPITAVITIVIPKCNNGAVTRIYTEQFTAAFQGQTAAPDSVTITSVGRTGDAANVKCGKANQYAVRDSLTIAIA